MQFLLSVIHDQPELTAPDDDPAAIDAFIERLQVEGHWVFTGGLGLPDNALLIDGRGEEGGDHRWAVPGVEGVPRRLLDGRGPDLDAALELAAAGSMVAALTRRFGDLDIAEEAVAETLATAVERWPADGVPSRPGVWLATTASRKAIDRIRRETSATTSRERLCRRTTTPHPNLSAPSTTTGSSRP